MNDSVKRITGEITAVIERSVRQEMLREREARLEAELAAVRAEIGRAGAKRPIPRRVRKPVSVAGPALKPAAGARRMKSTSTHALLIEALKRAKRPKTIKELTKALLRNGWTTTREDQTKTVDAALRNNPEDFRLTAPGTFELIR